MLKNVVNTIRRNHALEHATITLMLAEQGPMRVVGRAGTDGFHVYANVTREKLELFARQALERLQRGEASLAVSPLCGTNIAVGGILAGAASYLAIGSSRKGGFDAVARAIIAGMLGVMASQPLGRIVQKNYTTSPDLDGVRIVSVEPVGNGRFGVHKVRTAAS
ncbi:MAG: DUF6391 domain-containing protein [Chloroflexota bacterium]